MADSSQLGDQSSASRERSPVPRRLPAVDTIDWEGETRAMVTRHLDSNPWLQQNVASFQPGQGSNQVQPSNIQPSNRRHRMTSSESIGQGAGGGAIGTGPAWLGEMAPYVLTGDREGVGFNGLLEVDGIYDVNAVGLVPNGGVLREFITSEIPVTGTQAATRFPREVISPNQTQLGVWFEQPTELARFRAYTLMNLFGSDTTVKFQVYKVYANYGWFKAGKDYTLFFNQAAAPDTIDFEGPNVIPYVRFPQIAINIPLADLGFRPHQGIVLGVEHAPAELTLLNGAAYPPGQPPPDDDSFLWGSVEQMPSIVCKYVYTPERAHIELAGLLRKLTADGPDYRSSAYGYGFALSGKISTWGQNNVILGGQGGEGIGAYSQDSSDLGLDAAPSSFVPGEEPLVGPIIPSQRGPLRAIPTYGCWAAYQHFWTKTIRSTATFSILASNDNFVSGQLTASQDPENSANNSLYGRALQARYASVNLIWSPNPTFTLGVEYMYGHRYITGNTIPEPGASNKGQANRLQACVRWNFDHTTPFNK